MNIEELQEKAKAVVEHINSLKQKIQDDLDKYLSENLNFEQIELDINIKGKSKRKEVILQMLEIVPQSILDFIKKRNCIIEIVKTRKELCFINEEACKEDKDTDRLLGSYLTEGSMCRIAILDLDLYTLEDIEDYNDGINYEMAQIFLHELGHLIDNCKPYGYVSKTPTFLAIYNKEKDYVYVELNHENAISNSTEYFASMFCEYITRSALLKIVAPKTYEFMKRYIENL
jgi:hypothetical protein